MSARESYEAVMRPDLSFKGLAVDALLTICTQEVASFPGLPRFHSSVCVQYNTQRRKAWEQGYTGDTYA